MRLLICRSHLTKVRNKVAESDTELVFIGIGRSNQQEFIVEKVYECKNISDNPRIKFYADPICIYEVHKEAELSNRSIVLLIHSHPTSPEPSYEDEQNMKIWPIPWLIIDSSTGESKAWIIKNNKLLEINIDICSC
ncbi:MAG: Mov34/MPN/PAD-1 family protein [Desulfurococcaceae archaeon]